MRSGRTLGIMLCAIVLGSTSAGAWLSIPNSAPGDFGGGVTDMLVLPDGDVIAVADGDDDDDGAVVRFAGATGTSSRLAMSGVCRRPEAVTRFPDGGIVVSGSRNGDCDEDPGAFMVIRYDEASNARVWSYDVLGRSRAVLAGAGNMLVAAGRTWTEDGPDAHFDVVRLDPATGRRLWKFRTYGSTPDALALAPNGDVLAGGGLPIDLGAFGVIRIDAATGTEVWRDQTGSAGYVTAIAVDAAGDVIAAGPDGVLPDWPTRVAKVAGDDGRLQWTRTWPRDDPAPANLAVAANGDPVVAISTCDPDCRWIVERLAAADGTTVWSLQTAIAGDPRAVGLTADGDVLVTGRTPAGMTTLRLAGVDGMVRWRSDLEPYCAGTATSSAGADVEQLPDGDVVVGGTLCVDPVQTPNAMAVATLRGDDGAIVPTPTTSTTTTTIPESPCAQLRRAGCMDGVAPKAIRRRLGKACAGDPAQPAIRRRLASRIARLAGRGRVSATCAAAVALHRGA